MALPARSSRPSQGEGEIHSQTLYPGGKVRSISSLVSQGKVEIHRKPCFPSEGELHSQALSRQPFRVPQRIVDWTSLSPCREQN
jgi:hypothetical protein